ncbi:MAG: AgmX/PglI C-terminal domain-containing protein [Myxococcales bacterium]|nr:AgmX/PglI C-terminal domain-containing protein [Myxococcales bacterium]
MRLLATSLCLGAALMAHASPASGDGASRDGASRDSGGGIVVSATKVIYRSGPGQPKRFIIHGVFARAWAGTLGAARRGFLYYYCPSGRESDCQREWSELAGSSGSGTCRIFGGAGVKLPLQSPASKATRAQPYPLGSGVRSANSNACAKLRSAALASASPPRERRGLLRSRRRRKTAAVAKLRILGGGILGRGHGGVVGGAGVLGPGLSGLRGLGLRGTGRGGGGVGYGRIGLGRIGTLRSSGRGYGRLGRGRLVRRRGPRVYAGSARVRGSLSKPVIRRIVRRHLNIIRYCYQRQLMRNPTLQGSVWLRFVIAPSGRVASARVEARSTLKDLRVRSCIARSARRWLFPRPAGGGIVVVNYPINLRSR